MAIADQQAQAAQSFVSSTSVIPPKARGPPPLWRNEKDDG